MCELLIKHLATWQWDYPAGGSALWINLPDTNAQAFAQLALRHGVEVIPGHTMDPSGAHDSYIRLPYTFPETVTTEVVRRLAATWNELQRHGPSPAMPDHLIV
jgi:DNA-binding transcriptional MocR family regulator